MGHLLRDSDAMTITIGAPELIDGREGRRVLAEFYGELLGMREFEPYGWLKLASRPPGEDYAAGRTTDGGSRLQLALDGDGWSDQRPPRWPDPEYPQQMHLDIVVPDADAADKLVLGLGATLLKDQDTFRTYADPAGHPFCLHPDQTRTGEGARVERLVFDCLSPRALASFYQGFLGVESRLEDSPEWVVLDLDDDDLPNLAFQHARFRAARWPDPAYPAQLHVDYRFPDGAPAAMERAERHGAIHCPVPGNTYSDPAGHPFCL
ncbi:VOC family protein [Actinopolymorpha rutila]|uniref:Glyoxalase-like domain-containing protein n=1 Tax=Actinopolymorpha rutila TaxID=446787 RepID=A0A852ZHA9_9ACTN|nr:VOC family protein [Actinopolymorpha rutila]NYH92304.1 hypothetical protein [Actinopolymorpha rutila]